MGLFSGIAGTISGLVGIHKGRSLEKLSKKAFREENPFGPYRDKYAKLLGELTDDPTSFLDNPLYQAAFGAGTQAVMRGFASEGFLGSGNMATGLQQFGMGFGFDALQKERAFLAMLAGADQDPDFAAALSGKKAGSEMIGKGINDLFGGLGSFGGFGGSGGSSSSGSIFGGFA